MRSRPLAYDQAPIWVERTAPQGRIRKQVPALLLLELPGCDFYSVATSEESNAIANPNSFVGRLLRAHCALLALQHISNN